MEDSTVGCLTHTLNATDLVDYNITSCVTPFTTGRWNFDMIFRVHPRKQRATWTFILFTNIACYEPFSLVAVGSIGCDTNPDNNKSSNQCLLVNEIPAVDGLTQCRFSCVCIRTCSLLIVRHNFLPWKNTGNPATYRACEINIVP